MASPKLMEAPKTNNIFIVEDEAVIRQEVRECLTNVGYDCVEAASGEQALDLIRQDSEIVAVLADIQMSGRSGLETMKIVNSLPKLDFD